MANKYTFIQNHFRPKAHSDPKPKSSNFFIPNSSTEVDFFANKKVSTIVKVFPARKVFHSPGDRDGRSLCLPWYLKDTRLRSSRRSGGELFSSTQAQDAKTPQISVEQKRSSNVFVPLPRHMFPRSTSACVHQVLLVCRVWRKAPSKTRNIGRATNGK